MCGIGIGAKNGAWGAEMDRSQKSKLMKVAFMTVVGLSSEKPGSDFLGLCLGHVRSGQNAQLVRKFVAIGKELSRLNLFAKR